MSYVTKIDCCRCCNNTNLIEIMDLGHHALSSRFPTASEPDPFTTPLVLVKCDDRTDGSCGLLQLLHNTSEEELYLNKYGYRSGLNASMLKHLKGLVQEIEGKIQLNDGDIVVDIGGNDSSMMQCYANQSLQRYVIDPTGQQFKEFYPEYIHLVPTFFNKDVYDANIPLKAKVITTVSMLYDLPRPCEFAQDLADCLDANGIWVCEQSYCFSMLDTNSYDTILSEHLEYYCLKQIQYIADTVGLEIIDVSLNACNGGSFRVTLAHKGVFTVSDSVAQMHEKEMELNIENLQPLYDFIERVNVNKDVLVSFLKEKKENGKTIWALGSSTKGNTTLQYCNLNNTIITAAGEVNPNKYGCRTPGTNIPILSEIQMRIEHPDYLLALPWHFKEGLLLREKEYLDNGGVIIFPMPTVECYNKDGLMAI